MRQVMRFRGVLITILLISGFWLAATMADAQEPDDTLAQDTVSTEETSRFLGSLQNSPLRTEWHITVEKIFWAALIFILALFLIRYLTRTLERMSEPRTNLRLTIKRLIPTIRIVCWAFVSYVIVIDIFAPSLEALFAISASAGIAIGFASQDVLKNIFGGITILVDRPFQVGDKIEIGNYYGEVTQIGLRSVRIVTPDDSQVSVPNGEIMNQLVSNTNTGESNAQVVSEFYLPPDVDMMLAKKIAFQAAAVSRYVYLNKPISVMINNEIHHGRSILKMRLKAYVLDIRYEFPFASEITETVLRELLSARLISTEQLNLLGGD